MEASDDRTNSHHEPDMEYESSHAAVGTLFRGMASKSELVVSFTRSGYLGTIHKGFHIVSLHRRNLPSPLEGQPVQ